MNFCLILVLSCLIARILDLRPDCFMPLFYTSSVLPVTICLISWIRWIPIFCRPVCAVSLTSFLTLYFQVKCAVYLNLTSQRSYNLCGVPTLVPTSDQIPSIKMCGIPSSCCLLNSVVGLAQLVSSSVALQAELFRGASLSRSGYVTQSVCSSGFQQILDLRCRSLTLSPTGWGPQRPPPSAFFRLRKNGES